MFPWYLPLPSLLILTPRSSNTWVNFQLVNWLPPLPSQGQALVGVEHLRLSLAEGLLQRFGAEAGPQSVG